MKTSHNNSNNSYWTNTRPGRRKIDFFGRFNSLTSSDCDTSSSSSSSLCFVLFYYWWWRWFLVDTPTIELHSKIRSSSWNSRSSRLSMYDYMILLTITSIIINQQYYSSTQALVYDGISEYQVMEGDQISLPCNISTSEWNQNQISLVVWYRSNSNQGNPIYSIDSRGGTSSSRTRHQVMPELDGRIRMDFHSSPHPVLHIDSVQINDHGDYRCRVDYRMNRTKHFLIHLNVSVLPKSVTIRDPFGTIVQGLVHTPYNEGDKVSLYCDAIGGSPPPIVIWKNNDGKIIDDSFELIHQNHLNYDVTSVSSSDDNNKTSMLTTTTRNHLEIPQLDRSHLLKEFTCEAYPPFLTNNSVKSGNVDDHDDEDRSKNYHHQNAYHKHHSIKRTSVVLDLNLRPLSVQIQVPNFQPNLNRSASGTVPSSSLSSTATQLSMSASSSSFSSPSSSSSSTPSSTMMVIPSGYHSPTYGNVLVVSAGKQTEIECRTWGSRPPAEITWWRGSRRLPTSASRSHYSAGDYSGSGNGNDVDSSTTTSSPSDNNNNNLTISTLTYIAAPEDHMQRLTCRADNPHLEHEEIEDSVIVSVRYAPQLTLSLGAKIPENIREGSDVYFECQSKSNPPLTEVVWLFEGKPLVNDPVSGVLVTNQSLVMQRVGREHRGNYQCAASNPEGISASNKVFLNVHFAPVCKPTQTIIYGVARTEHIVVTCQVEAEPATPIQFRWFFNNSYESYELPRKDFTMELLSMNDDADLNARNERNKKLQMFGHHDKDWLKKLSLESVFHSLTKSIMMSDKSNQQEPSVARSNATYSPRSRIGYGLLFCMAENSVGMQRDPCVFTIVEAGPPNSVHDCRIANVTMASFILECVPGENGGLRQIFHLEVYNIEKEHLQANVTALDDPIFSVENLPHDTAFMLNVFSSNAKGRSDSVTLRTATSAYAAKHTTNGKKHRAIILDDINQLIFNPIFGALVVALISLVLLCMATVVFIRSRLCPPANNQQHQIRQRRLSNQKGRTNKQNHETCLMNSSGSSGDLHKPNLEFKQDAAVGGGGGGGLATAATTPTNASSMPCTTYDHHHHHPSHHQQQQYYRSSPFTETINQSAYYHHDYHHGTPPHLAAGPPPSLSTSDSTALTEITTASMVNLNNNVANNQQAGNYRHCYSPAMPPPPGATSTAIASDLMTNAFTYNIVQPPQPSPSSIQSTSTNAIYPLANDAHHHHHHILNCHPSGYYHHHQSYNTNHQIINATTTTTSTIPRHISDDTDNNSENNTLLRTQPTMINQHANSGAHFLTTAAPGAEQTITASGAPVPPPPPAPSSQSLLSSSLSTNSNSDNDKNITKITTTSLMMTNQPQQE